MNLCRDESTEMSSNPEPRKAVLTMLDNETVIMIPDSGENDFNLCRTTYMSTFDNVELPDEIANVRNGVLISSSFLHQIHHLIPD